MHLVPYDRNLLFDAEEIEAPTDSSTYNPLYSASKIRWKMKEKGISQVLMGKRMNISQGHLSNILSGRRELTEDIVGIIADILGVGVDELVGYSVKENEEEIKEENGEDNVVAGVKIHDLVGFKNKIREWLTDRGMKTRDLSGMLGFDERDIRITRWFHGTENPTVSDLLRICEIMGCEVGELIGDTIDIPEETVETPEIEENLVETTENPREFMKSTTMDAENPREFKDIIYEYMREHNLGRKAFAELIGTDTSTVSRWWTKGSLPSEKLIKRISDATGLNLDGVKIYEGPASAYKADKKYVETTFSKNITTYMNVRDLGPGEFCDLIGCSRGSLYGWLKDGVIPKGEYMYTLVKRTGYCAEDWINKELEFGEVDIEPKTDLDEYIGVSESITYDIPDDRESPLDIDILKAEIYEDLVRRTRDEIYEDLVRRTRDEIVEDIRKEFTKEVDITLEQTKPVNPNQERIDNLKKAAQRILDNAESIVGNTIGTGDLTVSIYLNSHEVPRVTVDYDLHI